MFVTEKVFHIHSFIHSAFTSFSNSSVDHNLFTLIDIFFLIDISYHKMEGSKVQSDMEIHHNLMDMSRTDLDQIKFN